MCKGKFFPFCFWEASSIGIDIRSDDNKFINGYDLSLDEAIELAKNLNLAIAKYIKYDIELESEFNEDTHA